MEEVERARTLLRKNLNGGKILLRKNLSKKAPRMKIFLREKISLLMNLEIVLL